MDITLGRSAGLQPMFSYSKQRQFLKSRNYFFMKININYPKQNFNSVATTSIVLVIDFRFQLTTKEILEEFTYLFLFVCWVLRLLVIVLWDYVCTVKILVRHKMPKMYKSELFQLVSLSEEHQRYYSGKGIDKPARFAYRTGQPLAECYWYVHHCIKYLSDFYLFIIQSLHNRRGFR